MKHMIKPWVNMKMVAKSLFLAGSVLLMGSGGGCGGPSPDVWYGALTRANPQSKPIWTPDGSQIVFSSDLQGLYVLDVAGASLWKIPAKAPIGTLDNPGYFSPALSPDGSRLAFVVFAGGTSFEIATSDLDGSNMRRLSHHVNSPDGFTESNPVWSPDGTRIAYTADEHLTLMDADGSNVQVVVSSVKSLYYPPAWSPDGSWLTFVGLHQDISANWRRILYLVRPDGSELIPLGATASVAAWSPDGSRIAFVKIEDEELVLQTLMPDGTEQRDLLSLGRVGSSGRDILYETLSWSHDGTAILYASAETQEPEVVVVSVDSASESERILARVDGAWAAWSPDGSRIAVVTLAKFSTPARLAVEIQEDDTNHQNFQDVLYTVARDGTEKRVLVRGNRWHVVAERADE